MQSTADAEQTSEGEESLSSLMQAYSKVGLTGQSGGKSEEGVSEDEAMLAFSTAKLNGVKVMELPDKDPKKEEQKMSDTQEIAEFQANEMAKEKEEETKKVAKE